MQIKTKDTARIWDSALRNHGGSAWENHALHPYRGKYQGQRGATGSKVFLDKDH